MSREKTLSYQLDEILRYQSINNKLPQQLACLCTRDLNTTMPNLASYTEQLDEIISNTAKGINTNSVVFRNLVKYYVNMITPSNYQEFLQKLKGLDYTTKENIHFLASELIIGAIRCQVSVKGFTFQEDSKIKTVPEICADVAKHFSQYMVENESNNVIQFHDEITKICQQYFLDFIDMNKSMDENNEDTADNYKGFMTFMGLLYSRGVVNIKAVINCMDTIKKAIYASNCVSPIHMTTSGSHNCCDNSNMQLMGSKKQIDNKLSKFICYYDCNKCGKPTEDTPLITYRKHVECINLHKGYEHLITHVTRSLDMRSNDLLKSLAEKEQALKNLYASTTATDEEIQEVKNAKTTTLSVIDKLCSFVDIIIKSHQEMINLNKCYLSVSQNKTKYVNPLKQHSIITHNSIGHNLNALQDKLKPYSDNYSTRYIDASFTKST